MEITGKIIRVLGSRNGVSKSSGNPWVIQEYLLQTLEARPRQICFEVFGEEKIKTMNIQEGEELVVSIEVESREYQGRWFTTVRAWQVARHGAGYPEVPPVITGTNPLPPFTPTPAADPLPFEDQVTPF